MNVYNRKENRLTNAQNKKMQLLMGIGKERGEN